MAETSVLSFDEFRQFVAETLGVVEGALTPETHFLNDLAVESLKLLELMLQFELQLGRPVSPDAAWEILTVGDAYSYYLRQAEGNAL
jgi:acyl carrier protein